MKLTTKLMLALSAIVVTVAVFSGLFTYKAEERQLLKLVEMGADQLSRGIASATWHAMLADRRDDVYQIMSTVAAKQGIDRIRMFNRTGDITFSTHKEDQERRVAEDHAVCQSCHRENGARLSPQLENRIRYYQGAQQARNVAIVTPIYNEKSCSQAACHAHPDNLKVLGVLEIGMRLDEVDSELANIQDRVIFRVAVEIVAMCVFLWLFTRHFVRRPIQQLIAGTHAISQMELDRPIEFRDDRSEIAELAHSFDAMRVRLRDAIHEINQFTQHLEERVEERTRELQIAHEKLRHSDRLASLGQLSASVAHEINNPVAGVLNLSMLMQRLLKEDGIPHERLADFRRYLSQVVQETSRVGRIVSDLLSFSRRSSPHREQSDLQAIAESTLSLVAHKLRLGNVEIERRFMDNLPPVHCDRSQIQQVVLNLVLNAAEAMQAHQGGRLLLETGVARKRESVWLRISDDGEGIPPEHVRRIFDPFFTTKPEGKGVGLGLAVSYGIVQAHAGELEVQSAPGQGTTFTISLPLQAPAAPISPAPAPSASSGQAA
jgi:two-component system NtrC family sensor kinase